jgi:hypothetical protein
MTSVFDKITEKSYIEFKKDEYLELFKKDLENYHEKESEVHKLYVKLLGNDTDYDADDVEDTYWVLKTYDSLNYNSLIISWIENNFDRYKKINEDLINAGAQNNYSYDKAIIMIITLEVTLKK